MWARPWPSSTGRFEIDPDFAPTLYNLGRRAPGSGPAERGAGRVPEGKHGVARRSGAPRARGDILHGLGRLDEAAAEYHRALGSIRGFIRLTFPWSKF